jgi:hypothetical protein
LDGILLMYSCNYKVFCSCMVVIGRYFVDVWL